jgi:hypothetical protein
MNALQIDPIRALATLAVALLLASCSTSSQSNPPAEAPAPQSGSTPTGAIEVLPTSTPAATAAPEEGEATVPPPEADWVQESYGDTWSIGYPAGWTVNDAGAHEGALQLQGDYEGHNYIVTYSYPIGILADSLEAWVEEALLPLTLEQREAVVVSDVMVANTPVKKVLNMPTPDGVSSAHHVYIWHTESKNPRLITITQTDGQPVDSVAMDQLLDRLLVTVQ